MGPARVGAQELEHRRQEIKRLALKRSAVHDALLRAVAGDRRAGLQMTFMNWKVMTKDQRKERNEQDKIANERLHWEEREKEFLRLQEQALSGAQLREVELRAKAHAASEMMLR